MIGKDEQERVGRIVREVEGTRGKLRPTPGASQHNKLIVSEILRRLSEVRLVASGSRRKKKESP